MVALVMGCTQPPARQGASRSPTHMPSQPAIVQLASAAAASDHERERHRRQDIDVPPRAAAGAGHASLPVPPVSSVRHAPSRLLRHSADLLSITQVSLNAGPAGRDLAADALDWLERRLYRSAAQHRADASEPRRLIDPAESLAAFLGASRPTTGASPPTMGELGSD
ncbi:MAG: hypothetical protein KF889_16400 [Alphaproteobacteria bacterium]|nr:hypothetical protein [Alphaproteobacteria bacterium]MCW5740050.1 hypothetical protein [Alphaproteobacteria bacterium]